MSKKQVKMLSRAITLAATHHEGQLYGGKPYILHPMRVMQSLHTCDLEIQQIAIMHDLVEDTPVSGLDLVDLGFSHRVVSAVALLTHNPKESYEDYIKGISVSKDATIVKLADLADNSAPSRQKGDRQKDKERLVKYAKAVAFLEHSIRALYAEEK